MLKVDMEEFSLKMVGLNAMLFAQQPESQPTFLKELSSSQRQFRSYPQTTRSSQVEYETSNLIVVNRSFRAVHLTVLTSE